MLEEMTDEELEEYLRYEAIVHRLRHRQFKEREEREKQEALADKNTLDLKNEQNQQENQN